MAAQSRRPYGPAACASVPVTVAVRCPRCRGWHVMAGGRAQTQRLAAGIQRLLLRAQLGGERCSRPHDLAAQLRQQHAVASQGLPASGTVRKSCSSTMRSASLPGSTVPMSSSRWSWCAALTVMAASTSSRVRGGSALIGPWNTGDWLAGVGPHAPQCGLPVDTGNEQHPCPEVEDHKYTGQPSEWLNTSISGTAPDGNGREYGCDHDRHCGNRIRDQVTEDGFEHRFSEHCGKDEHDELPEHAN